MVIIVLTVIRIMLPAANDVRLLKCLRPLSDVFGRYALRVNLIL